MDTHLIIQKIMSRDSLSILEATREILKCADKEKLQELGPYVSEFRKTVSSVELGGAIYPNKVAAMLALSYIEKSNIGICRCELFEESLRFNPVEEQKLGHASISKSDFQIELYETHFDVSCCYCEKEFVVRENIDWHIPLYKWKRA